MPDRIIKESICTSDTLNSLTDFEERVFFRLTVCCDDFGRFDARPNVLLARLFTLRTGVSGMETRIKKAISRLEAAGLVELYEIGGRPYLQIVTWDKHQRRRAQKSKYPGPQSPSKTIDGDCQQPPSSDDTCQQTLSNVPEYESVNESVNESERKRTRRFVPPTVEEVKEYCQERQNDVNADDFVDFYTAKGWMVGKSKMQDWKASVRTWERKNKQAYGGESRSVEKPPPRKKIMLPKGVPRNGS